MEKVVLVTRQLILLDLLLREKEVVVSGDWSVMMVVVSSWG